VCVTKPSGTRSTTLRSSTSGQIDLLKRVSAAGGPARDMLARKRRQIATVLNRIRPMLRADGLDVDVIEVQTHGASVRLTGVSGTWCQGAPLNFHTDLERVLRQTIARFGDLQLV
jgi:Fe-S cluster biogenesis protein NfuA